MVEVLVIITVEYANVFIYFCNEKLSINIISVMKAILTFKCQLSLIKRNNLFFGILSHFLWLSPNMHTIFIFKHKVLGISTIEQ